MMSDSVPGDVVGAVFSVPFAKAERCTIKNTTLSLAAVPFPGEVATLVFVCGRLKLKRATRRNSTETRAHITTCSGTGHNGK